MFTGEMNSKSSFWQQPFVRYLAFSPSGFIFSLFVQLYTLNADNLMVFNKDPLAYTN